ncbi:MAG: SGNH/GDSL hydrolase family protein [Eubacteriales bacterium]|nr:SGNH/GDSL hydrolase family protein [Eubacteriales bacterium]
MKTLLFTGDSITDAGRSRDVEFLSGSSYATLAASEVCFEHPGEFRIYNRGVSGNRIVDLYARLKVDLINLRPDYLSILIGVNDVWHELAWRNGVAADKFERVYDMLLGEVRAELPETKILILEPFVLPGTATKSENDPAAWRCFSAEVPLRAAAARRVAEKHGATFVPLQKKLDEALERAESSYWLVDGVHPNFAGNELIKREWIAAFNRIL